MQDVRQQLFQSMMGEEKQDELPEPMTKEEDIPTRYFSPEEEPGARNPLKQYIPLLKPIYEQAYAPKLLPRMITETSTEEDLKHNERLEFIDMLRATEPKPGSYPPLILPEI